MTTQQAYEDKVKAHLDEWQATVDSLKAKMFHVKADTATDFQQAVDKFARQQDEAKTELAALKQVSSENYDAAKKKLDQQMNDLQQTYDRLKDDAHKAGEQGLSWAKGLADEHFVQSIGWGEGVAKEDKVESIGWAEGVAKEDKVESIGWAEGYSHES